MPATRAKKYKDAEAEDVSRRRPVLNACDVANCDLGDVQARVRAIRQRTQRGTRTIRGFLVIAPAPRPLSCIATELYVRPIRSVRSVRGGSDGVAEFGSLLFAHRKPTAIFMKPISSTVGYAGDVIETPQAASLLLSSRTGVIASIFRHNPARHLILSLLPALDFHPGRGVPCFFATAARNAAGVATAHILRNISIKAQHHGIQLQPIIALDVHRRAPSTIGIQTQVRRPLRMRSIPTGFEVLGARLAVSSPEPRSITIDSPIYGGVQDLFPTVSSDGDIQHCRVLPGRRHGVDGLIVEPPNCLRATGNSDGFQEGEHHPIPISIFEATAWLHVTPHNARQDRITKVAKQYSFCNGVYSPFLHHPSAKGRDIGAAGQTDLLRFKHPPSPRACSQAATLRLMSGERVPLQIAACGRPQRHLGVEPDSKSIPGKNFIHSFPPTSESLPSSYLQLSRICAADANLWTAPKAGRTRIQDSPVSEIGGHGRPAGEGGYEVHPAVKGSSPSQVAGVICRHGARNRVRSFREELVDCRSDGSWASRDRYGHGQASVEHSAGFGP
ncbi:hypothetical protein C8T65DRAFT_726232, partial [Cerioporus squamosus]